MKRRSLTQSHRAACAALELYLAAAVLLTPAGALAQQALRNTMTAEAVAATNRINLENMPYTFKSGDFRLLLTPSAEADWNDNINLSRTNALQDYILRPLLLMDASYPITQVNLLRLNVGVGYDEYLQHHGYSNWRVISGTELSFDTYIKDVLINVHDRFSYVQDAGAQSVVAGTGDFGSDENVAGVTVSWNPKDLDLSLSYDHQNVVPTGSSIQSQDLSSELVDGRVGWRFEPTATAGIEATYSSTSYDQAVLNNNDSYTIGAYGLWAPGTYFKVVPRVGYVVYEFQNTSKSGEIITPTSSGLAAVTSSGVPIRTSDLHSWYADLTLSHNITRSLSYALSVGHEIQGGVQSDAVEDSYVRLSTTWSIIKNLSLGGSFSFEHGRQGAGNIAGNLGETFDWYTGGINLRRQITSRLSVGLESRVTYRDSTVHSLGYTQALVGLQLAYAFQ